MIKITKPLKQYTFNQILHNCNSRKHFRNSTHNKQALFSCFERQWGDTIKCVRKPETQDFKQVLMRFSYSFALLIILLPLIPSYPTLLCVFVFFIIFSGSPILFASCLIVAGKKENLVIEWYRTCALPARRWQMDYKNFKGKHLEHQGRDARYLNYHSLPRRQWLPDMLHTSRNSAMAQAQSSTHICTRTPPFTPFPSLSLCVSLSFPRFVELCAKLRNITSGG